MKPSVKPHSPQRKTDSKESPKALLELARKRHKELDNLLSRINGAKTVVMERLLPLEVEHASQLRQYIVSLADWWHHPKLKPSDLSILKNAIGLAYARYEVYENDDDELIASLRTLGLMDDNGLKSSQPSMKPPKKKNTVVEDFAHPKFSQGERIARKLFLDLAKKFHPDKPTGEMPIQHQTALMQTINEAYGNNDTLALLNLHQQHLSSGESFLQETIGNDNQLKTMLKEQAEGLVHRIESVKKSLSNQLFLYFAEGSIDVQNHKLQLEERRLKLRNTQLNNDISATQLDAKNFVRFLKETVNR